MAPCWRGRCCAAAGGYFREYGEQTTIHGIGHIIAKGRHPVEIFAWLLITVAAAAYACSLIYSSHQRYLNNPTVVELEKNHLDWNVTFPALTYCRTDRLDPDKASEFIKRRWPSASANDTQRYMQFLGALVNLTYDNLDDFEEFVDDPDLGEIGDEMEKIALQVQNYQKPRDLDRMSRQEVTTTQMLGEHGLCFAVASAIAQHLVPREDRSGDEASSSHGSPLYCQELNAQCTSLLSLETAVKFAVHSPLEVPEATTTLDALRPGQRAELGFMNQEITCDPEVRELRPSQRHCSLPSEPQAGMPFSSYSTCLMQCRRRLALRLCGCAPYFYNSLGGNKQVCNAKGLACLAQHKRHLVALFADGKEPCACTQPCIVATYILTKRQIAGDSGKSFFMKECFITWAVNSFSTTRYKKTLLFGVEDLLVSYGGTASFFLGCSLLSLVELVYFFTLRLLCVLLRPAAAPTADRRRVRRADTLARFLY